MMRFFTCCFFSLLVLVAYTDKQCHGLTLTESSLQMEAKGQGLLWPPKAKQQKSGPTPMSQDQPEALSGSSGLPPMALLALAVVGSLSLISAMGSTVLKSWRAFDRRYLLRFPIAPRVPQPPSAQADSPTGDAGTESASRRDRTSPTQPEPLTNQLRYQVKAVPL